MSKELLDKALDEVKSSIKKAVDIADEHGLQFDLNLGSPRNVSRDIAGTYYGKGLKMHPEDAYCIGCDDWNPDHVEVDEMDNIEDWEDFDLEEVTLSSGAWEAWTSSSEHC